VTRPDEDRESAGDGWKVSWEEHREEQLARTLTTTPAERLEWLEGAIRLAYGIGALPRETAEDLSGRLPDGA